MRVLALDGGSSSLKFALYAVAGDAFSPTLSGEASGFGQPPGHLRVATPEIVLIDEAVAAEWNAAIALERVLGIVREREADLSAVGHRIVFGGPNHVEPVLATPEVLRRIEEFVALEPLHLRVELDAVYAMQRHFPGVPQILCFDTAFHRRMPAVAKRLPLPRNLDPALQRYGFHGLSYEYVLWRVAQASRGRVVIAHLGNGASLCALKDGLPMDTTMGFSALGGLMMGTRPGDMDPGVLLYLLGAGGYRAADLADLLNYHCGLLGVSGSSASMEALLAAAPSDASAREAVELFVHQLVKHLGAMIAVLGGLDALVFTGGIGERAASIRSKACEALGYAGVRLDDAANAASAPIVSRGESRVGVHVVPADETLVIARHAFARRE